jgi:hypothetical protein
MDIARPPMMNPQRTPTRTPAREGIRVNTSRIVLPLFLLLPAGCSSALPELDAEPIDPPVETGSAFDSARAGRVSGRVTWTGAIPNIPGFLYGVPRAGGAGFEFRTADNPNRPQIDPKSRTVGGAVIFLRGVNPTASRPWDLPPAGVEIGNGQIVVVQGERRGRSGFVRRGDEITISSTEAAYHVLRGRGDAFFSLPLPQPKHAVTRRLAKSGRVELSSGTGLYWARADLFVADHPYYTVTDADGRFTLERVPAGKVEVVVWLPGWQTERTERDPDSTQVARQTYSRPVERAVSAVSDPIRPEEVNLTVP